MTFVQPIDSIEQKRVKDKVNDYLYLSESIYQQPFCEIPVNFDLKGKAAGMYRVRQSNNKKIERVIRFNPWLFAKYPDDSWQNTIPHEVAHYIADCLYGMHRIRPHGKEWKIIMHSLGAEPIVRGRYDLEGIPTRQVKRFTYACACRRVQLSSIRHKRIQTRQQVYRCRDCHQNLTIVNEHH